jgi:GNAT superfamily N-acetyltransferase
MAILYRFFFLGKDENRYNMIMPFMINILTRPEVIALHRQIVEIFRNAFTPPPYNKPEWEIVEFGEALQTQLDREAYKFAGAFDEKGQLLGFAYGYATSAAKWRCTYVRPAMTEHVAEEWLDGAWQFTEIAVDPQWQGRGVGSRLHNALLQDLPYQRAVLSTLQADTTSHKMYRSRGWIVLVEDLFFPDIPRRYQIMGKKLEIR